MINRAAKRAKDSKAYWLNRLAGLDSYAASRQDPELTRARQREYNKRHRAIHGRPDYKFTDRIMKELHDENRGTGKTASTDAPPRLAGGANRKADKTKKAGNTRSSRARRARVGN